MFDLVRNAIVIRPRFWLAAVVIAAALIAGRFLFETDEHFASDGGAMRAYISAIGTLYGILAAFIIYVVWNQFTETDNAVRLEANELFGLCQYTVYLDDPHALETVIAATDKYAASVLDEEWEIMATGRPNRPSEAALDQLFEAVHAVSFDDARDHVAWGRMIEKFEAVADAREKRIDLSGERMPELMRGLLILISGLLLVGFFMVSVQNDFIAVVTTIATTAAVFLTMEVINDLDDPFEGYWALSKSPFISLRARLAAMPQREEARSH